MEAVSIVGYIPSAVRCIICQDIMTDAEMLPCQHAFCARCIRKSFESRKNCPICQRDYSLGSLVPSRILRNIIGEMRIVCPEEECEEIVQFQDLEFHRRDCTQKITASTKDCGNEVLKKCFQQVTQEKQRFQNQVLQLNDQVQCLENQVEGLKEEVDSLEDQLRNKNGEIEYLKGELEGPIDPIESNVTFELPPVQARIKSKTIHLGGWMFCLKFLEANDFFLYHRYILRLERVGSQGKVWSLKVGAVTIILKDNFGSHITWQMEQLVFTSDRPEQEFALQLSPYDVFSNKNNGLQVEINFLQPKASRKLPAPERVKWDRNINGQFTNFSSSLRNTGDTIYSPSFNVGGIPLRLGITRINTLYDFFLSCNDDDIGPLVAWEISVLACKPSWLDLQSKPWLDLQSKGIAKLGSRHDTFFGIERNKIQNFLAQDKLRVKGTITISSIRYKA